MKTLGRILEDGEGERVGELWQFTAGESLASSGGWLGGLLGLAGAASEAQGGLLAGG